MIDIKNESIEVSIENQKFDLPFLWLRDNCQCDECRITETQEKQFLLHTVPVDISPEKIDMVDLFRAEEFLYDLTKEAIEIDADVLWMQEGLIHED